MNVKVIDVVLIDWLVLLSCKADQSFVVDVDAEGVAAGDECVDAEVELESFVEERVVDIGLDHALPIALDFSDIPRQIHESDCDRKIPRP
jgi:hypothetical protein